MLEWTNHNFISSFDTYLCFYEKTIKSNFIQRRQCQTKKFKVTFRLNNKKLNSIKF
jgi:hypothetical protein